MFISTLLVGLRGLSCYVEVAAFGLAKGSHFNITMFVREYASSKRSF